MTIRVRHSGAWILVKPGALRFKESPDNPVLRAFTPDTLVSPSKIYVKWGGLWVDTGYEPSTAPPTDVWVSSWSVEEPLSIEIGWSPPLTGVRPDSYFVELFAQNGTRLASQTVTPPGPDAVTIQPFPLPGRSASFSNNLTPSLLSPLTNYYVTVTSRAVGAASASSEMLKIRTGRAQQTRLETVYGWSAERITFPAFEAETSSYSDMGGENTVDPDVAIDTTTGPRTVTKSWVSGSGKRERWEGLQYSLPNAEWLLTKVRITGSGHLLMLGVQVDGEWIGNIPPAPTPVSIAGGGNAIPSFDTYELPQNFLYHNYLARNTDDSSVRFFDVEDRDLRFSSIDAISVAVTRLVNIYGSSGTPGTPGTPGSTTRVPATIPSGYVLWIDGSGKWVRLVKGDLIALTPKLLGTGSSTSPFTKPVFPPSSAFWPPLGKFPGRSDYRLEYSTGNTVRFRQYFDGSAVTGTNAYLKYSNGTIITKTMTQIFTPGSLGYFTDSSPDSPGTPGTPAVPAWRAKIDDVRLFYRERVATGTRTVVEAPQVDTVSGASSW